MTNREVLSKMSTEQLAKFLNHIDCGQCIYNDDAYRDEPIAICAPGEDCVEGTRLWLEAEAKPLMTGMLKEAIK